jgi:putative YhdH/YhfP family quinone oxidoreductase
MDKTNIEMSTQSFKAFYVEETETGTFKSTVREVPFSILPDHEVTIRVQYSSLNYKDALSISGNKGVTRNYPHIPGIDASGVIEEDESGTFKKGQKVLVTGRDLGSNTSGGFGQYIRIPKDWVVVLPKGLNPEIAMWYGTAGFTAMYGVKRLQRELVQPETSKVLVTGATGGVGSMAVFFLSELGYEVTTATGKMDKTDFLKSLGATEVIDRNEITDVSNNYLLSRKWKGSVETVGGKMLDAVIRQLHQDGAVACCGNILGDKLETNIYPFILRGVSLLGIDSAICKRPMRLKIWKAIAAMNHNKLPQGYINKTGLNGLKEEVDRILQGKQTGRVLLVHE